MRGWPEPRRANLAGVPVGRRRWSLGNALIFATAGLAGFALAGFGLAGCGASERAATPLSASQILARARATVNATRSVHFALSSQGIHSSSSVVVGGQGDLLRPAELSGTFTVAVGGFDASVGVVETGGTFYALTPFASHYTVTNPADYGLGNPAQLLSPSAGVSALLTRATDLRILGDERIAGELLVRVSGSVPGAAVPVLPDLARSKPVSMVVAVDPVDFQVREVVLTGPFASATSDATYTVTLTGYGEAVHIAAPRT